MPWREGGRLPLREGVALDGKYSELATLRLSSVGECTEAASGHDPAETSWWAAGASTLPKPKLAKPLATSGSARRAEVKFVEVGSSSGLDGFATGAWPTAVCLGIGKKPGDEVSANG